MKVPFAIVLDFVARRYGQRPSALVGITGEGDESVALSFDVEVATIAALREEAAVKKEREKSHNVITGMPEKEDIEAFFESLPEGSKVREVAMAMKREADARV